LVLNLIEKAMKKFFTSFFSLFMLGAATAQWSPAMVEMGKVRKETDVRAYYSLDLPSLRMQLTRAHETGKGAKAIEISLPTLDGKIEKFAIYSFPVVVKELADQYQLGSYVGVGIDDPTKYVRFSVAPNNFQSMIIKGGEYEFIEPSKSDKTIYEVHGKSKPTGGKSFVCSTDESPEVKQQIDELLEKGKSFTNQPTDFSKMSDKKYRTMKLVVSVTGEYAQKFGGTVAGALAQVNATLTRVNGVFEKDFALHLNLQNYPGVIYLNGLTDPYSDPDIGTDPANSSNADGWNVQLQQTLSVNVGSANYDIGHLFGDSGGGGNAGCIGCVCVNPTGTPATSLSKQKGSGFTSPGDGNPSGDTFDIDYVAHEIGHQLGANHTFSHAIEGAGVNVEPGSGSTIMGYAGITGANTDVQSHSDAYFHIASIKQVQTNLIAKTCDVETPTINNPPTIAALPSYTIPTGTAFVLTASATDPENDPMTYTWEQVDSGMTSAQTINKTNLGTTTYGASFRSFTPTASPTRYFPKLTSVLEGVLNNSLNTWESTSQVARTTKFAVTVRDNNSSSTQQQTQYAEQIITIGADGPFKISNASAYLYSNATNTLTWDVANTASGAYNSPNVKIDYSIDNGVNWTVLLSNTPNDGSEVISIPASLNGQFAAVRVSSIGNVFYALKKMMVTTQAACGSAVSGVNMNNITTSSATVNWAPVSGAISYVIRYKKTSDTTWQQTTSNTNTVDIPNLLSSSTYEVQVSSVCGSQGPFSASATFSTLAVNYCVAATVTAANLYISKVQVANINNITAGSTYTDYTINPALQINLVKGTNYPITINSNIAAYNTAMVFIDYNKDGVFAASERVVNFPVANVSTFTGSFTVPTTGVLEGQTLRMRVLLGFAGSSNVGLSAPAAWVCGTTNFNDGEFEDYNVVVTATALATHDVAGPKNDIQIYPNPVSDILNITKVSDKASYKIYSAAGQLVRQGTINNGQINVSELIKGGYVITVEEKGKESFTSKFIKK
jgi:hypothetical protein